MNLHHLLTCFLYCAKCYSATKHHSAEESRQRVQRLESIIVTCSVIIRTFCCVCGIHWRKIANSSDTVVASSHSSNWQPAQFTSKKLLSSCPHATHNGPSAGGWITGLWGNFAPFILLPASSSIFMPFEHICILWWQDTQYRFHSQTVTNNLVVILQIFTQIMHNNVKPTISDSTMSAFTSC